MFGCLSRGNGDRMADPPVPELTAEVFRQQGRESMKKAAVTWSVCLVVGFAIGVFGGPALRADQEPVTSTPLLTTDVAGAMGKEVRVFLVEFAPGVRIPGKHYHPGNEIVYVLEGSLILDVQGKSPVTFRQGEIFQQPPGQVHTGKNGSATTPTKLLQFLIADKGKTPAVQVP